ncbi:hypothetical protein ACFQU2_34880 [Siccirubricoccus deserti]
MPSAIQSVAVFCGSRSGTDPAHAEAARALGAGLATRGMTLVYGGGGIGLMGEVAKAALDAGGRVRGVIPNSSPGSSGPIRRWRSLRSPAACIPARPGCLSLRMPSSPSRAGSARWTRRWR